MTATRRILDLMSEADLQRAVIDLAHLYGWRVSHQLRVHDAAGRHRTPVQGDVGGPDLLLARRGVVLHVELKSERGRLGPGQAEWGEAIGETWRLWRPRDMSEIVATLGGDA